MSAGQLGYFIGAFATALFVSVIWLLIANLIPPLRRKPAASYGVAMALAFVPALIATGGPNLLSLGGAALCCVVLFWQMRRAQAKLRGAGRAGARREPIL